ncbi:MAG: undecaprenyl-phosphate glucose phosphotransferase [Rubrivivax sp.]|nr:undecaprenyl-phosphate glucose phosphotransferase [Rubrivivax sp.]
MPLADSAPFRPAPPSVEALTVALFEPLCAAISYLAVLQLAGRPWQRHDLVLALFVFLLRLPGRNFFATPPRTAAQQILLSWAGFVLLLLACGWITSSLTLFDPHVMLAWMLAAPLVHAAGLVALRQGFRHASSASAQQRRAVVVGGGPLAVRLSGALRARPGAATMVLGYFDDRGGDRVDSAARAELRGGLDALAAYVRTQGVHEVYVTLPLMSQPRIAQLVDALHGTTASLYFVPDVLVTPVVQGRLDSLHGLPVLALCETPFTGIDALVKRASDLVIASVAVVLLAPLMAAIAVAVRMDSPGPALFRQRRNGLGGEEIVVWKFRSMRVLQDGAVVPQATKDDPRITRVGAFLRRTSLDELPQFFNVLQGRMSVVGPRPHAVAHNEQYRALIRAYQIRHKVRPGITGWAQVHGCRGETDTLEKMQRRVEYDIDYLRHWSLALDLRIVLRTARLVLWGDEQAY